MAENSAGRRGASHERRGAYGVFVTGRRDYACAPRRGVMGAAASVRISGQKFFFRLLQNLQNFSYANLGLQNSNKALKELVGKTRWWETAPLANYISCKINTTKFYRTHSRQKHHNIYFSNIHLMNLNIYKYLI